MTVAELIEHLKTFPQDVQVSANNGQDFLALVVKGGITLEEAGRMSPFFGDYRVLKEGEGSAHYEGPHVAIVGGNETHHGSVEE